MGKEGYDKSKTIVTAAGIGLGALLLVEGGRRVQEVALKHLVRIDNFEDKLPRSRMLLLTNQCVIHLHYQ